MNVGQSSVSDRIFGVRFKRFLQQRFGGFELPQFSERAGNPVPQLFAQDFRLSHRLEAAPGFGGLVLQQGLADL